MLVLPVHIHVSTLSVVLRTGFFTLKACHMVALAGLPLTTSLILSQPLKIVLIIDSLTLVLGKVGLLLPLLYFLNDVKPLAVLNLGARECGAIFGVK